METITSNLLATKYRPFVLIEQRKGEALAISEDGEVILRSTDHWKVIQETFNHYENQAKKTGVWIVLFPRDGPFIIKPGQTGIHIPCENGGRWIISSTSTLDTGTINLVHEGSGNVFENSNAYEYLTFVTIEYLQATLRSKVANGIFLQGIVNMREVVIIYDQILGKPDIKNYGIAVISGDHSLIQHCRVYGTVGGFLSQSEHLTLLNCKYDPNVEWCYDGEVGFCIPQAFNLFSVLEGYDLHGQEGRGGRHSVLIDCHVASPDTWQGTAFWVSASTLVFPKVEGGCKIAFRNDWGQSTAINPYFTGPEAEWMFYPPETWVIIGDAGWDIMSALDSVKMVRGGIRIVNNKVLLGRGTGSGPSYAWSVASKPLK